MKSPSGEPEGRGGRSMTENPYQPPKVELIDDQPSGASLLKRFRYRFIPATLCFVYGGLGLIACVILAVTVIPVIVRVGPERFNLVRMVLASAVLCGVFGLVIGSGWLWLRGKWLGAVSALVVAFLVGVAMRSVIESLNGGKGKGRDFYKAFIKPDPRSAARYRFNDAATKFGKLELADRSTLRHR
jgi:hypothetical protein